MYIRKINPHSDLGGIFVYKFNPILYTLASSVLFELLLHVTMPQQQHGYLYSLQLFMAILPNIPIYCLSNSSIFRMVTELSADAIIVLKRDLLLKSETYPISLLKVGSKTWPPITGLNGRSDEKKKRSVYEK